MPEYTYADVIIDPEDPRVEIGAEYYFGDNVGQLLHGVRTGWKAEVLRDVCKATDEYSPFYNGSSGFSCIIRKKEVSYAERQAKWIAENCIQFGDKVRVTRKADSHEDGWNNGWFDNMTNWVGKVFKVNYFNDTAGIQLLDDCGIDCGAVASFPYFVLEKVEQKYVPFKLSKPEVRDSLRGKWFYYPPTDSELMIDCFSHMDSQWRVHGLTADQFLNACTFLDGSPCGEEVAEA